MKGEFLDYVQDILENARKALVFVEGMTVSAFERDEKTLQDDLPPLVEQLSGLLRDYGEEA